MAMAACAASNPSDSGGDGSASAAEKVKVRIAGQTADSTGAYALSLEKAEKKDFTLVVGSLTDYAFTVVNSATSVVSASVTQTTLTVEALEVGTAVLTVSENSDKAEDLVVNISVTEKSAALKAPTGVNISGVENGTGGIADPYVIAFSEGKTSEHSLVVRPSDADKRFDWTVGSIRDGAFTAAADSPLTAVQNGNKLTLSASAAGAYAIEGKAKTGDLKLYIQVAVTEYTELTGITANLTESEEAEYDYYFKTAKGTTWNMTEGMTGRSKDIADGKVITGYQIPLNQTYYPSLYKMVFTPVPAEATDCTWVMSYTDDSVFTLSSDGNWTAEKAGSTVVTVSNTSKEAEIKIKVDVVDTLYEGVLKSEFDAAEADASGFWNFDSDPDDYDKTKAMLEKWHLVMNKTTSSPNGADGNQKMFYLGAADRVYGICLETRIDSSTGVGANAVTALTWAKAHVPAGATTMTAAIGNNDKTFGSYRITLVKGDGTSACITNGWVEKTKANDDGKPYVEYEIPEAYKDCDVAIVIETSLAKTDDNCELHIKGVWINSYKQAESVTLAESAKTVGQRGTYKIVPTVLPADASYKTVAYTVLSTPEGGANGIQVAADGTVTVTENAPVGEYKIKVTSTDNADASAVFTLTVEEYNPLTQFEGSLYLSGREIVYGGAALKDSTIHATLDPNGIYTDKSLEFKFLWNEGASKTTYTVELSEDNIVAVQDGLLKFVGAGTVVVKVIPDDNRELAFSFTVVVGTFDKNTSLIPGTNITLTSAAMLGADNSGRWTDAAGMKKFTYNTVDRRHSNAKWDYDGDAMRFESHVIAANSNDPVNIAYNYVNVAENAKYLTFKVHGHGDDRYLESSNVRVRVAYLEGEAWTVDLLLDWTTIASRWKQENEWYTLAFDMQAYAGKNVVVLLELVGGLQNNGNFPKGSDSAAGGYLYLKEIALSETLPEGALLAEGGEIPADYNTYRMYANGSLSANGWTVSANGATGSYSEKKYTPLKLTYTGSLTEQVALGLTTDTFYSNKTAAMLYPWGVFPALNNSEQGSIRLSSSDTAVFTIENGVLMPVANGTAKLLVEAPAYGSGESYVTFEVTVIVAAVETSVKANAASVTIEAGGSYTFDYYTVPAGKEVNFAVTQKPENATEAMYSFADGKITMADNALVGNYVVRISLKDDANVYCDVTVTVAKVTSWNDKAAIIAAGTGWNIQGGWDQGVGEGADINDGSYLYRTLNMTGLKTLTVSARVFVRSGERNPKLYISVIVDGVETKIRAKDATEDYVVLDTNDTKYETPQAYIYDLSAYAGKKIEVRIGNIGGSHCVVTSIAAS